MSSTDLQNVEPRSGRVGALEVGRSNSHNEEDIDAADYYEILRVAPQADADTIERVYRTLADRFRPDNLATGDQEAFLRLTEAWETLSDKGRRARYDVLRQEARGSSRFRLRGRAFFDGVKGGQNRRLAVLCLLYRKRISAHESPGLTILDLEQLTGCTHEELTSALWYLCEKQWAAAGDYARYSITAGGFDFVEQKVEDRAEFHRLATLCYYRPGSGASVNNGDILPLDIEPALANHEGAVADHYEILGIRPQADEETIERVYRTLADRFHPDNPSTGDAKTLLRIREAYDTLSDPARRAQYDGLRQYTGHPERFRLRGREFFDGIRGEQLRRLAVLCLLYRQAAGELPGLTVLDLEQLTGCTREELGSSLWYLREKKWAKLGEFTEYSITAAGFDAVESKLDEREAARSQAWLTPEDSPGAELVYPVASAKQVADGIPPEVPVPPRALLAGVPDKEKEEDVIQPVIRPEEIEEDDAVNPWAWLNPGDTQADESVNLPQPAPAQATEYGAPEWKVPPQPPGVIEMSISTIGVPARAERNSPVAAAHKRVVFSMGGKGGVGKTSVMIALAEWFEENRIPVVLLDLDTENKAKGSLAHFFDDRVPKINIQTPAGLDAFVDILAEDAPAILADMGAGAGRITHDWFHKMYPDVTAAGVAFTAIGVVTSDPASVDSVLDWADALQDRVAYVIAENNLTEHTDFAYWQDNPRAQEFRKRFQPFILRLDYRLADLENAARNHGATLGRIARRNTPAPELQKASLVMRAQSARRRMFEEFDKVRQLLLP